MFTFGLYFLLYIPLFDFDFNFSLFDINYYQLNILKYNNYYANNY